MGIWRDSDVVQGMCFGTQLYCCASYVVDEKALKMQMQQSRLLSDRHVLIVLSSLCSTSTSYTQQLVLSNDSFTLSSTLTEEPEEPREQVLAKLITTCTVSLFIKAT